jgi:hypothetical protein
MNNKHLNFGVYKTTDSFRSIKEHSCVCFDDMTLVAVTGPADDKDSQKYAELFAASPDLLKALEDLVDYHSTDYDEIPEVKLARVAIAKAKGETAYIETEKEFPVYYDAQGNEHAEY